MCCSTLGQEGKEKVEVHCPSDVMIYSKFMRGGGVDLMNLLIASYRINVRSKKRYEILFHFLDMAVVNSWLLYRKDFQDRNIHKNE